jgi:hypothetical protein
MKWKIESEIMKRKVESGKWKVRANVKSALRSLLSTFNFQLSILLLLSTFHFQLSTAQHYVGVKAGYGAAQGRFYPPKEGAMTWGKYTGGVMWKYYSPQQVVGGVSAELEYQTRGYRIFEGVVSDTTDYKSKTRIVNSISMPLIWQPHLYLANRHIRVFVNAGIVFTCNLGIGDTFNISEYRAGLGMVSSETAPYKMITARDNRWNYGLCGGFGFGVLFGRWEVFAEGRYYFGMSDILRNSTKYQFNEEGSIRSELDNLFINVGVFFRLGKGGITEAPLRRNKDRVPDTNSFSNIKLNL